MDRKNNKFHYLNNRGGINAVGLNEIEPNYGAHSPTTTCPHPMKVTIKNFDILQKFSNLIDDGTALLLVGAACRSTLSYFTKLL